MFDLTLSFDNGPEPGATPGVLDILSLRGIKTTFFVIGEKLNQFSCVLWTLMVLHDLPTGALNRLEEFLDRATRGLTTCGQ